MNTDRETVNQFSVDAKFYNLVNQELIADTVSTDVFWNSLTDILKQHACLRAVLTGETVRKWATSTQICVRAVRPNVLEKIIAGISVGRLGGRRRYRTHCGFPCGG